MKKTHLIGIIIGLTIILSILPAVNAVGSITFVSPTGETYRRGDTLVIEAVSYADAHALLQIKRGTTVKWADQVIGAFSPNFVYTMVIPSDWAGGTYTVSHAWLIGETTYKVRVITVDSKGAVSPWSDPCSISIPKSSKTVNPQPFNLIKRTIEQFPMFTRLLHLLSRFQFLQ